jgi:hypothetical protein
MPFAAPATASTLSRLIDTSATTICVAAWAKVFRGASSATAPSLSRSASASASTASILVLMRPGASSCHIFQQTQRSRMPPASRRPAISRSCVVTSAKPIRITVAAMIPTRIALARCSLGRPAAARPITMALSPASTRSMPMTCKQGDEPLVGEDFHDCPSSFSLVLRPQRGGFNPVAARRPGG